jgi:hypothetical protein
MQKTRTVKTAPKKTSAWRDSVVKKYLEQFQKQGNTGICADLAGSRYELPKPIGTHVPDISCTDFSGRHLVVCVAEAPDLSPNGTEAKCAWRTFGKYAFFNQESAFLFIVPKDLRDKADLALRGFCLRGSVIGDTTPTE